MERKRIIKKNTGSKPVKGREERSYSKSDKPFDKEKRSFSKDGHGKPERKRFPSDNDFEKRDNTRFSKSDDSESRGRKSFTKDSNSKPYERKSNSGNSSFVKRDDKKFSKSEGSGSRDRKNFSKDSYSKPYERKSSSGDGGYVKRDDRKFSKSEGTESRDRKSFSKDSYSKPYEKKSFSDKKSYVRKDDRSSSNNDSFENSRKRSFSKDNLEKNSDSIFIKKSVKKDDETVRLNKYIANSGICSRREADDLIKAGLVSINGEIVTEMGIKVLPTDDVRYNGERMKQERMVYILLNKPKDYITTLRDPHAKRTVLELIEGACKERVYPVGRLDRNTTGVLLLTNDGELTKKLTHPSYNKKKIYHVHLDQNVKSSDFKTIIEGMELEDGFVKADSIQYVSDDDKKEVGIEIHSGQNRIVRRIFEKLFYRVIKLDRVYFAGLTKKGLQRGQWRFLTTQEVNMLKMGSYE